MTTAEQHAELDALHLAQGEALAIYVAFRKATDTAFDAYLAAQLATQAASDRMSHSLLD